MNKKWFDFIWVLAVIGALALSARLRREDFEENKVVQSHSRPSYLMRADVER